MLTAVILTLSLAHANTPAKKIEIKDATAASAVDFKNPPSSSLDLGQFKELSRGPAGSGTKFSTSCKSRIGTEYKSGDSGYTACLSEAQGGGSNRSKEGSSQSVNFQLGD